MGFSAFTRGLRGSFELFNNRYVRSLLPPVVANWRSLLVLLIFSAAASIRTGAQGWDKDKPLAPSVIVDLGLPRAWTMEQAHYLLERNRARDLGLTELDPSPLNPNDTVGVRASALQSLFSGSVSFDQALGAKNRAATSQFNEQAAQYNATFKQRADLIAQQAGVAGALAAAQNQLLTLQSASPQDPQAIAQQNTLISQLTAQNTALSSEITSLNSVIGTPPTAPSISTSQPADETTATALGDNATFDNIVKGFNTGPGASKLSASIQLDNYVNLQYEMVAKQLTLLQDQAGPDSRVLFLELPHSIYVTDKLHLYPYFGGLWGNHLVQSWWTIGGALQVKPLNEWAIQHGAHRSVTLQEAVQLNKEFATYAENGLKAINDDVPKRIEELKKDHERKIENLRDEATTKIAALEKKRKALNTSSPSEEAGEREPARAKADCNCPSPAAEIDDREVEIKKDLSDQIAAECERYESEKKQLLEDRQTASAMAIEAQSESSLALKTFLGSYSSLNPKPENVGAETGLTNLVSGNFHFFPSTDHPSLDQKYFEAWATYWLYGAIGRETGIPGSETAPIYAIDLIPRQSSLNVAEAYTSTHQLGFAGIFGWLSGLGARARYERQKQEFGQYTQLETYATAFGKGDYTFGWTFGPKPGTKEIDAGLRTTYAILVVPKETRIIRLNALGCGYRRREVPRDPFSPNAGEVSESNNHGFVSLTGAVVQNKLDSEDCGKLHTFDVEVPNTDDDFWIEDAQYNPVPAGQRVTLRITGRFGDTVGVLVNGTPLQKVPSVTQPILTPGNYAVPANAGDAGTQGVFEIVHTRSPKTDTIGSDIVATFVMPATFVGTPKIMIVSAARDTLVNEAIQYDPWRFTGKLLEDDPKGPMFFALPVITRVDADYPDNANARVKIVGRGFNTSESSSLVFGKDALKLHTNAATDVAPGEFRVLANGAVIEALIVRKDNFPQWSIDYVSQQGKQVVDANISRDDSVGPPVIAGCKFTADPIKDGTLPVNLTVTGSFFSSSMTPAIAVAGKVLDSKSVTSQFVGSNEWDFNATVPVGTKAVGITLVPVTKNLAHQFTCVAPAAKAVKAAAKAVSHHP